MIFVGFYTIVLTEYMNNCQEIVRKILNDCWSIYIANVIVLTPSIDYDKVLLYTYFPYTPDHCEVIQPIVLDHFENGTFVSGRDNLFFPDKFRNFHKCALNMASYNFTPLVMLIPQPNGSYYIDGIEGTVIRVLSQRLNFTVNVLLSRTNLLKNITNSTLQIDKRELPRSLDLVRFSVEISINFPSFVIYFYISI